jgi:hypothetical protein
MAEVSRQGGTGRFESGGIIERMPGWWTSITLHQNRELSERNFAILAAFA